ncbi:MAG TPA: hypothetical protein VEH06_14830 [Candidatus Bathyarchaeia archaeon]|nr:hypothetical protein [Candidatus Bathyarchaeia archaeon]
MKNILGFTQALLLDLIEALGRVSWFLIALLGSGLLVFSCSSAKSEEVKPDKNDHSMLGFYIEKQFMIVIQTGYFNCQPTQHRIIKQTDEGKFWVGCATIGNKEVSVVWDDNSTEKYDIAPPDEQPQQPQEEPAPAPTPPLAPSPHTRVPHGGGGMMPVIMKD